MCWYTCVQMRGDLKELSEAATKFAHIYTATVEMLVLAHRNSLELSNDKYTLAQNLSALSASSRFEIDTLQQQLQQQVEESKAQQQSSASAMCQLQVPLWCYMCQKMHLFIRINLIGRPFGRLSISDTSLQVSYMCHFYGVATISRLLKMIGLFCRI